MTIQQDYQLRPHVEREFTQTGIIGPPNGIPLNMTGNISVVIENVSGTNAVQVQGRLVGQASWTTVSTVTGASAGSIVDMSVYDEIRFNCSVYSASGGTPKLISSGFFKKGGANPIFVPSSSIVSSTPTTIANDATYIYIPVDTSALAITINLPALSAQANGREYIIKDISRNASRNNITIDANGSELIDGNLTFVMTVDSQSTKFIKRATGWDVN